MNTSNYDMIMAIDKCKLLLEIKEYIDTKYDTKSDMKSSVKSDLISHVEARLGFRIEGETFTLIPIFKIWMELGYSVKLTRKNFYLLFTTVNRNIAATFEHVVGIYIIMRERSYSIFSRDVPDTTPVYIIKPNSDPIEKLREVYGDSFIDNNKVLIDEVVSTRFLHSDSSTTLKGFLDDSI